MRPSKGPGVGHSTYFFDAMSTRQTSTRQTSTRLMTKSNKVTKKTQQDLNQQLPDWLSSALCAVLHLQLIRKID